MCTFKDIDNILLPNGKNASEANSDASREIEHIYLDSWQRGVSVPFLTMQETLIWPTPMAVKTA